MSAIGRLVEIEQEVRKGAAASPIVVANAPRLREVYYERLRTLGSLSDALAAERDSDTLYDKLRVFGNARPEPQPIPANTMSQVEVAQSNTGPRLAAAETPAQAADKAQLVTDRREAPASGTSTATSTFPQFSQIAQEYITMRAGGMLSRSATRI